MKKALCTAFAAVFFLAALTACSDGISTEYESSQPDTFEEHTDKANENISCRVEVNDMKFTVNGNELWINGTNTPWQNWNDFVGNMDEAFWDNELARLAKDGINCTRIWISCNGEGVVRLNDNGEILSINEGHWSDLDKLFDLAEKHKVYLMPTFLSFDHFKEPKNSAEHWRALISSKETSDAYAEKYVREFCERYKDRECIFAIDIMNEPDWVYENEECGQIEWEHLSYFFGKCAQTIHENSNILVTVGMGIIKYNSDKFEGNKVSDEYLYELTGNDKAYLDFITFGRNRGSVFHVTNPPRISVLTGQSPALSAKRTVTMKRISE